MLRSIALLVFCVVAVAFCDNKRGDLIVGGDDAGRGKYPEFAIIYRNGEFYCGGTILNRRSVLTAAHCIDGPASIYSVAVGKYRTRQTDRSEVVLEARSITVHPSYDDAYEYDIAIIRLKGRITYDALIQPAQLAKSRRSENFTDCYAVGVGTSVQSALNSLPEKSNCSTTKKYMFCKEINGSAYPRVVQELATTVISQKRCKRLVRRELDLPQSVITKNVICTLDQDAGVCFGDSGGPVGCFDSAGDFVQMGLLSYGSPFCADGFNVFTRVSQMRAWIKANA